MKARSDDGGATVGSAACEWGATPGARILIVDDDAMICVAIRRGLADHAVTSTTSPCEALALIVAGEQFDLILCDLAMPRLSGAELHAAIAAVAPEQAARMIFMTGGALSPELRSFRAQLTVVCLDKPFELDELRAAIDGHLARAAPFRRAP